MLAASSTDPEFFMKNRHSPSTNRALLAMKSVVIAWLGAAAVSAFAQAQPTPADRGIEQWLSRMHDASRNRAYQGTFVVSSRQGMSSSRIWHVCDGKQQMERVEVLTGAPRSTFRHNDQVVTFLQDSKVARSEQRESLGVFPGIAENAQANVAQYYNAQTTGTERVAGVDADIVTLSPKDSLRFGYRIWSEKKSGLVVKVQTLDENSQVLEQAAFSELQMDAPVKMGKLASMMNKMTGYTVEKADLVKTTPNAMGWNLRMAVPGFVPVSCHKRGAGKAVGAQAAKADGGQAAKADGGQAAKAEAAQQDMQWVFSDGLATVSLFVEPFDSKRHSQEGSAVFGATHTLTRKVDGFWLTAMGEVPVVTLRAFASAIERRR
jgi:sigma-E factor negative regulatory protein RseB